MPFVTRTRSSQLGPAARSVAVPDDVDEPWIRKAEGKVILPLHARWSGPPKTYLLAVQADGVRVYEQVLREGDEFGVRRFVDVNELLVLWEDLVLPPHVRRAWADWYRRHRGVDLEC